MFTLPPKCQSKTKNFLPLKRIQSRLSFFAFYGRKKKAARVLLSRSNYTNLNKKIDCARSSRAARIGAVSPTLRPCEIRRQENAGAFPEPSRTSGGRFPTDVRSRYFVSQAVAFLWSVAVKRSGSRAEWGPRTFEEAERSLSVARQSPGE